MRILYHYPHDPLSRQIRLLLAEKNLDYRAEDLHPMDSLEELASYNPAKTLPIFLDEPPTGGDIAVCPTGVIIEYIEEAYPLPAMMPATSAGRAEVRRLCAWYNEKFDKEVSTFITREYIDKRLRRQGQPDADRLRIGRDALLWHMDYINWLSEERAWLGGEKISLADLVCAAHLSCLDYCDMIPWQNFPQAKEWYARLKSRPSFRPLLQERVQGLPPPRHYTDPDF